MIFILILALNLFPIPIPIRIDCEQQQICPKCSQVLDESKFHSTDDIVRRRWQTPKPGEEGYQTSYQDFHSLVSTSSIRSA